MSNEFFKSTICNSLIKLTLRHFEGEIVCFLELLLVSGTCGYSPAILLIVMFYPSKSGWVV